MKYTCTIEINAPLEKVVSLWSNEKYFKEWQDGFESIKLLTGTPETQGATSRIILDGQQRIELIETILLANLPEEKIARYEHIHMTNTQASRFEALANSRTRYTSEVEYIKFNGLMIKLMAKLFPSKFKAQSQKWMDQFKAFVENIDD
ncbi:MAG: SRPBCC family protein [Lewinella sp.]|uniref:SRPBCC family protein n=1 Tax=Lewinella sp. TaxID=2004506 RepID=UPI003D6AC76E